MVILISLACAYLAIGVLFCSFGPAAKYLRCLNADLRQECAKIPEAKWIALSIAAKQYSKVLFAWPVLIFLAIQAVVTKPKSPSATLQDKFTSELEPINELRFDQMGGVGTV